MLPLLRKWFIQKPSVEKFIWVGDEMAADGRNQIGRPVDINGKTGKVIAGDGLTITVQWEK